MSEEARAETPNDTGEVATLTRSQQRRTSRGQRSSEMQARRTSTAIAEEEEEVFEDDAMVAGNQSSARMKRKVKTPARSGFVPPTHVSGGAQSPGGNDVARKTKSSFEGKAKVGRSSSYMHPTRTTGPRSSKRADGKVDLTGGSSGFVPPTHVSRARSAEIALEGKAKPARKGFLRRGKATSNTDQSLSGSNRSSDELPGVFSSGQPSNIETNEMCATQVMAPQSEPANARNVAARDDQSIHTTSTMGTVHARNGSRAVLSNSPHLAVRVGATAPGGVRRPERRTTSRFPVDRRPMRMVMDEQGHTMSHEELRAVWERAGKCIECGIVQTYKKEKYGPFGMLRRMRPLTVEGHCYKGYCLRCHDVYNVRRLLNDDSIPLDLPRHDPAEQSLRALQTRDAEVMGLSGKRSPIGRMCASVKFQIFMGITLVGIAAALVFLGIRLTKDPEPWVPPPPTSAPSDAPSIPFPTPSPTSYEWHVVSELIRDDVDSFGHHVGLSADGQTLAVASPNHDGARGRLDVYRDLGSGTEWAEIGDAVVGGEPGDELGFSMSLSGDGSAVAVGSPGRDEGLVQVFVVDEELGLVPKGQIISGPTPLSQFGYSVAMNYAGDRLFVGAPQFALNVDEVYGMVQAFDFDGREWVQSGSDIIGPNHGSRFGHSISTGDEGKRVVVGAPLDDEKWEDAGQIHWYDLQDGEWIEFLDSNLYGSEEQSRFGTHVSVNSREEIVATGNRDRLSEEFPNAGVVSIWGIDWTFMHPNPSGTILGNHENARLGYDIDIANTGELLIVSGQNSLESAGSVGVFDLDNAKYSPFGQELFGPALGEKDWFGSGPSVAVAARQKRVTIGYENILSDDGVSHPTVRIYDYYASPGS